MNTNNSSIVIRPAIATDIHTMVKINHHYSSDHVWQMNVQSDQDHVIVSFNETRLPRSVQVAYPRDPSSLIDGWTHRSQVLIAAVEEKPVGYISLIQGLDLENTSVDGFVVSPPFRRQGIGNMLLVSAQDWAKIHQSWRITLELQPKNHAGIRLAQKHGYEFFGYDDQHFLNKDIALFFVKRLK